MAQEMNLWNRLTSNTPAFFKRVIAFSLAAATAGGALLAASGTVEDFVLSPDIKKFAQWLVVAGLVAASVGKSTVQDPKDV